MPTACIMNDPLPVAVKQSDLCEHVQYVHDCELVSIEQLHRAICMEHESSLLNDQVPAEV